MKMLWVWVLCAGVGAAFIRWIICVRVKRPLIAAATAARRSANELQAKVRELEASRNQMEGILQGMNEGVLVVGPTGELVLANEAARQIFNMGQENPTGRPFLEIVRQPELQELIWRILKTGQPDLWDLTLYAPPERCLQVHGTVCRTTGRESGALLVLHDITDLKRLEQVRRDFVANVSHELKTPLTAIQGAVETLLDGAMQDADRGRPFVESIAEEAARLHRLVNDLLVLAHVESRQPVLKKEPIPLREFLETEMARHRALADAHQVALVLETAPSGQTIIADRNQLAQAIGNLLDNAVKYNRPHGRALVRASVEGQQCRIEVEDTGIGIPPQDLPRIFERFYRVDKARSRETGGTGLGLSIIKHVAEAHGGSVQVESRLGHGSRFTLILPV